MLEDVIDTANSIGLSDEQFDVVRKGQDQFSVCVHVILSSQRQLQKILLVWGLLSRSWKKTKQQIKI